MCEAEIPNIWRRSMGGPGGSVIPTMIHDLNQKGSNNHIKNISYKQGNSEGQVQQAVTCASCGSPDLGTAFTASFFTTVFLTVASAASTASPRPPSG